MISFYPGPSKIYPQVAEFLQEAVTEGILSVNHRSKSFEELYFQVEKLIRLKLDIPDDYLLLFTSSATECWEIMAQSLTEKASLHFYNGAFGEKWFQYAGKIVKNKAVPYHLNEVLPFEDRLEGYDLICITQNETSNGTRIRNEEIRKLRRTYPAQLIAVDVTSSLAGEYLQIDQADLWFASVQKCFGIPAGLGLLICSPAAVAKAEKIDDDRFYNSFNFMLANARKHQTHYTPNVLSIYLLKCILEMMPEIREVDKVTTEKMEHWLAFFQNYGNYRNLVENPLVQSKTVLTISGKPDQVQALKKSAFEKGLLLGSGYGTWKANTFRIANYPQIIWDDLEHLQVFLRNFLSK